MEVTTVSSSPALPTEGDDLCEIDVTDVAIHSAALLICLCGLAGNGAVICLCPLQSPTYTFHLAVTDFLFLLFTVPSALLFLVEDVSCSPIMSLTYVSFLFQLSLVSCYWGLYWLMDFTSVFIMSFLCMFCCSYELPERLIVLMVSIEHWAFFVLFTAVPMLSFLCQSDEQEQCRAALISMFTVILLLFVALIVISSTINIIKAIHGSKKQQNKRQDIVSFLIVLFTLLLLLWNFLQQLGYIPVPTQVFFMLTCIYSSIKPFIYFLAGRCWSPCSMGSLRLSLQRVFEEKEEKTDCSDDANTDTVL